MPPRAVMTPVDPLPSDESMAVCAMGAVDMREAGRLIGKSRSFVYELVKAGRLRGTFIHGRDRVVPLTSIQLYLAEVRDAGLERSR